MKYIFIVLVFLIGGIIWLNVRSNDGAKAPAVNEVTDQKTQENILPAGEQKTTTNESKSTTTELKKGSDVGAELPETVVSAPDAKTAKTFTISGVNYAFDVKQIKVKLGDSVTINFKSMDGFHDFVIDEFNARTERVKTGDTTSITFVANKKGTLEYYCSVGQHRLNGMIGKLVVE